MVMNKKFLTEVIEYMKDNRHLTIAEKCKILGISVPGYYKACKRHGLNGGMRYNSRTNIDTDAAQKILDYAKKVKMDKQLQEITKNQEQRQKFEQWLQAQETIEQHESNTSICTPTQDSLK